MLKRLFPHSEIEKAFSDCRVDKNHTMVTLKAINDLAIRYFKPNDNSAQKNVNINININHNKNNSINININDCQGSQVSPVKNAKKEELVKTVLKRIRSTSEVMRIKGLIVAHSIIKKTFDQDFMEIVAEEMDKYIVEGLTNQQKNVSVRLDKEKIEVKLDNTQKEFIERNIISFYSQYLKKFIINSETFRYAQKFINNVRLVTESSNFLETINHGFIILNLVNYILQSLYTFNKMGRYYLDQQEVISLFMMYLNDLIIYNSFIKEISKMSMRSIKASTGEEMKHYFLFITEAQKSSDRLYEFFYNRYYYSIVKKLIMMPTFLTIQNEDFHELAQYVKKQDKQFLSLIKNSKYEQRECRSRSRTTTTEDNEMHDKLNRTDIAFNPKKQYSTYMSFDNDGLSLSDDKEMSYCDKRVTVCNKFYEKFSDSPTKKLGLEAKMIK